MDENNFKNGNRQPTDTDVALAKAYYPMLCELAKEQKEVTFKEFVEAAEALPKSRRGSKRNPSFNRKKT